MCVARVVGQVGSELRFTRAARHAGLCLHVRFRGSAELLARPQCVDRRLAVAVGQGVGVLRDALVDLVDGETGRFGFECAGGCGNRGDVESLVAGNAIARRFGHDAAHWLGRASAGEAAAQETVDGLCRLLGRMLYNLVATLDLERISLGGSVFWHHRAYLLPRLQVEVQKHFPALTQGVILAPAGLQDRVGDYNVFDLFFRYDVPGEGMLSNLAFTLTASNVFSKDPPVYRAQQITLSTNGFQNGGTVSRLIQLGVSKRF